MKVTDATKKIFLVLFSLVGFITVVFLYMGHIHHLFVLDTIVKEEKKVATTIYNTTFKNITEKYELIAKNILMNEQIVTAFEHRERERLLALTAPIYKELTQNNEYLKVMHFHTDVTRSFLRLHKPQKFGDDLSAIRHIINSVNRLHTKQVGLEVGRYGIYYRIALPVSNKEGKHLGAFEFGIDIDYLFSLFKKEYGFTSMLMLKKEVFDIMHEANKDLSSTTLGDDYYVIEPGYARLKNCYSTEMITEPYVLAHCDDRNNLIFKVTELKSIVGEEIGKMVFVKDLGFYLEEINLIRTITISAAVILLLFTFYLLRRIFKNYNAMIKRYQGILEQKNGALNRLNNTDHLTQVCNRRNIEAHLCKEINRAGRYDLPLSAILLDIDDFKKINDLHGHNVGDEVLKKVASIISSSIRECDHFGRWGGEEFIIISPQTSIERAEALAEKLRRLLFEYHFEELGNISCSFGIAAFEAGQVAETLVHNADMALYEAKSSGKNRVCAYRRHEAVAHEPLSAK